MPITPTERADCAAFAFPPLDAPAGYEYLPESRLAQELSAPFLNQEFEGVPLGLPLLVSVEQLILEGRMTETSLNPVSTRIKQGVKAALYPAVAFRQSVPVPSLDHIPRRGLLIRIEAAYMRKEWDLISGSLPRLKDLPVWLLCGEKEVPSHCLSAGLPALPNDVRLKGTELRFLREYYRFLPGWSRAVRALLARRRLAPGAYQRFLSCLGMTLMYGVQAKELLSRTAPRMVVVDCDHSPVSSWLVFFARRMGIPSVTLQHGTVADTPLWADHALLWGEQTARAFRAFGTDSKRLRLVGYPRLDSRRHPPDEVRGLKEARGIDPEAKVVVLATERGALEERQRLVRTAWEGVRAVPGHFLLVKCHPAESDTAVYSSVLDGDTRGRVFAHSELSLDEALSMADVVLAEWSSVAYDSLIKGRPVIVLDMRGELLSNRRLVESGACLSVKSGAELAGLLRGGTYDFGLNPEIGARARKIVEDACAAVGEEAASRIATELRSIWNEASSEDGCCHH